VLLRLSLVAALLHLDGNARANSSGITGYYGPSKTCMNCHLPQMRKGEIKLVSPAQSGKKYTFSFVCADTTGAGGTLPVAGVDIYSDCGGLGAVEPGTKIVGNQLIHTQARPTTNNAKTWQFSWTAPAGSTSCGFIIAGLLGDNNKKATGDVTCLAMKALLVLPSVDAGPPPPPKDIGAPPPKKDVGAPPPKQDGAPNKDGAPSQDAAPSDAAAGAESGSSPGDLQAASDSGAEAEEDDGCGCRLASRPADPGAGALLLVGALLVFLTGRRRRL
jgi:MYXO-CTERM domain-containing protein